MNNKINNKNLFFLYMSDTEEVVLSKSFKKNTKPEIAREKLKAKRERLKKEKDDKIIEEAKLRLLNDMKAEEEKKKKAELEKTQDPVHLMTTKLDRLVELLINKPKVEVEEVIEAPKKKRVVKPKQPRKSRKTSSEDITQESGDVFVGEKPDMINHQEYQESPQAQYYNAPHPLLNALLQRRNMGSY
jgi:hypothetical protein